MASTGTAHPHITKTPGVCGGVPAIAGTRFAVRSVVLYVLHLGMTVEELVRDWPHVSPAQVYDALSYYYDNQAVIDADILMQRRMVSEGRRRQR